jgi:alkylation response protein AidB-like acyl-CoA dehydrogenase
MRASPTAELVFEDVFVPAGTHVVGEVNGATSCMMRNLEIERVALAAMAVGIARRALDEMIAYAASRPAFGRPNLFNFGQIQRHITESYAEYMAGKCYLYGGRVRQGHTGDGGVRVRRGVHRGETVEGFEAPGDRRGHEREPSQEHV